MTNVATMPPVTAVRLPLGTLSNQPLELTIDLDRLLAGRLLIQGSSGAGKSATLRRLVEEAFEYVTVMIIDPEGEFENLARHIGATSVRAIDMATDGLTALAARARRNRLPLHLDLSDLTPDERIRKAAAFFAGLVGCPKEDWANTTLIAIDEAHLLAPHLAASARDAEVRALGVAALTDLCGRGRKRGLAPVIATLRLANLAPSVTSFLMNALIGVNVFDRDIVRAKNILGFNNERADRLRTLEPGEFFAFGPALARQPVLARIGPTATQHVGATPEILGPADLSVDQAAELLDITALRETAGPRPLMTRQAGGRALETFLLDPSATACVSIVAALRNIAPNATTAQDLAKHLNLEAAAVDSALDLLGALAAVDTMPRGDKRIARLSARLRLRVTETPVVGLA